MRDKRLSIRLKLRLAFFTATLLVASAWATPREKILHNFNFTDGTGPVAGLIFDGTGNLYGTTFGGGNGTACNANCGTVFELTPKAGGGWKEMVLHNFGHGTDGATPYAGLIFDASGNLYGTTSAGGIYGAGTVFELTPNADGGWAEKLLHSFNGKDGLNPYASLIFDTSGNLYGTTRSGGSGTDCFGTSCGTVFELTPKADGGWTEKVLHTFHKNSDGWELFASLVFDAGGNLYGTAGAGGHLAGCSGGGCGTVFELTPKKAGAGGRRYCVASTAGMDTLR